MAATVLSDVQFRAYIGPHHLHYDWSVHNLGASFDANLSNPVTTTGQISGATTLVIASSTGYGTSGGVWVGPNGTGEAWEYERFTARTGTTLTVTRESPTDREHNGIHSNLAQVYQFYPLTMNDGTLSIDEEIDDTASVITWRATLSGVLAPQFVLRSGHIVVITTSTNGGAYTIALVGFVDSPDMTDDARSVVEWTFSIVSSASLVAEVDARGVRIGEANLANAGSASAVQELVLPYDERASGDFTAASPDLSGGSAIDNEFSTLWLAEHFTGTDIWTTTYNGDAINGFWTLAFAHIYINPPPSAGDHARFIELRVRGNTIVNNYVIYTAIGGGFIDTWIFDGPGNIGEGESIFLVEDEEVFTRLNPLAQAAIIYENNAFFTNMLASDGELWLRNGLINSWEARVRWGNGNGGVKHDDLPNEDEDWDFGPTITAPDTGETMRYLWNVTSGTVADRWDTSMIRHAGYNIDNDDPMWIIVSLPGLGLTLAQDITSSVPGNSGTLYINGPDEKYSTDGLAASGTVFLGDEEIAYSSKTSEYLLLAASGARGANSTTAAAHTAGDEVQFIDGGIVTDAYLISAIGWTRGGSIYPKDFRVYTSKLISDPRNPDQDNYTSDWYLHATITSNASNNYNLVVDSRVRHILFEILSMTTDPARPRINEIHAIINSTYHNPDLWLDEGTTAGALIEQIILTAGIWPGAISHSGTAAIAESVTADDNAWTVVADIAEYAGCLVTVGRDSKFTIGANTFWTGTPSSAQTWNRSSAVSVQKSFRRNSPVSQVILPWKTPDGSTTGKIYYPASPERGTKMEKQETLYANSSAATSAARRLYFMRLYPFEAMVTASGENNSRRAGEIHQVFWQFNTDMQPVDRLYLCMSATHKLDKGSWASTFRLMQYGHESNF
jgi:hypothetical protein